MKKKLFRPRARNPFARQTLIERNNSSRTRDMEKLYNLVKEGECVIRIAHTTFRIKHAPEGFPNLEFETLTGVEPDLQIYHSDKDLDDRTFEKIIQSVINTSHTYNLVQKEDNMSDKKLNVTEESIAQSEWSSRRSAMADALSKQEGTEHGYLDKIMEFHRKEREVEECFIKLLNTHESFIVSVETMMHIHQFDVLLEKNGKHSITERETRGEPSVSFRTTYSQLSDGRSRNTARKIIDDKICNLLEIDNRFIKLTQLILSSKTAYCVMVAKLFDQKSVIVRMMDEVYGCDFVLTCDEQLNVTIQELITSTKPNPEVTIYNPIPTASTFSQEAITTLCSKVLEEHLKKNSNAESVNNLVDGKYEIAVLDIDRPHVAFDNLRIGE